MSWLQSRRGPGSVGAAQQDRMAALSWVEREHWEEWGGPEFQSLTHHPQRITWES